MTWTARVLLGAAAAMSAGAALACGATPCPNPGDGYAEGYHARGYSYDDRFEAWSSEREYGFDERRGPPPDDGEVVLPSSFFHDAGGVGPIPSGPYWTGPYVIVRGAGVFRGRASAFSAAGAGGDASARAYIGGRH